jgi:hypothetical protein
LGCCPPRLLTTDNTTWGKAMVYWSVAEQYMKIYGRSGHTNLFTVHRSLDKLHQHYRTLWGWLGFCQGNSVPWPRQRKGSIAQRRATKSATTTAASRTPVWYSVAWSKLRADHTENDGHGGSAFSGAWVHTPYTAYCTGLHTRKWCPRPSHAEQ